MLEVSWIDEVERSAMRRTQEERSAATQDKLLSATIECVVRLGYARTSTTEICRAAGVSRGAQVHHYPTKARLVAAAVERLFERHHTELRESLAGEPELDEVFANLWNLYSSPVLTAWMELLVAARTDDALRSQLRAVDESFSAQARLTCRKLLGLEAADEATVGALARTILSVFDGLAFNRTLYDDDASQKAALAVFKGLLAGFHRG